MEAYASVLLIAIPLFSLLITIEYLYGWWVGNQTQVSMDTISSLSSGLTNVIKDILGLAVIILSYGWLVDKIALLHIEATWLVYVLAFICIDFAGYCYHRLTHSVNYFWNEHMIHHSSEEFNLPCALRQEIANAFKVYSIFLIPAAILGLPEQVIAVVAPVHLFMQFWYHTKHIPKLGFLEYIIITPSQHRVHHAINDIYLDKNLGQVFCIWDRLFGTFQEELDEVPPVYGVKVPVRTWNPIKINFQHLWRLMKDAWHTSDLIAKFTLWFRPLGWRPDDVQEDHPIAVTANPYEQEKYHPPASIYLKAWSWFQLLAVSALLFYMLVQFTAIGLPHLFLYGLLLYLAVFGYTSMMDQDQYAYIFEIFRSLIGLGLILYTGGWFGIDQMLYGGSFLVAFYFVLTMIVSLLLAKYDFRLQQVELTA